MLESSWGPAEAIGSPHALAFSFFAMADGGDGGFERSAVVTAILGEKRNGTYLHPILLGYSAPYLLEGIAFGENAEEVKESMPATGDEWMAVFGEAWETGTEKAMPSLIKSRAATWCGITVDKTLPPPPQGWVSHANAGGAGSSGIKVQPATTFGTASQFGDVHIAQMMDGLVVSDHDVQKAIADINTQRISGIRIVALSLALMSGHVHPAGESSELRYASDMRLCPLIRQQRKAGVESLDDKLKAKNKRELSLHYSRLAKEYNDRGMIEEATLISQFWAETIGAFEGDDSGLFVYVSEWLRAYGGRGIPKLLDTDLILRHRKEAGGASSSEVKKLEEAMKALQNKVNASDNRNAEMAKRLTRAESKAASAGDPDKNKSDKTCFICVGATIWPRIAPSASQTSRRRLR